MNSGVTAEAKPNTTGTMHCKITEDSKVKEEMMSCIFEDLSTENALTS